MRVLIGYASRFGSTRDIAMRIADTVRTHGSESLSRRDLPRLGRALIYSLARPVFLRPEVGAIPVLRLAAHLHLGRVTGRFFDRCHLAPDVADAALAQEFWATCEEMTGQRSSRQKGERVSA
jgi:hypothetical protein